MLVRPYLWPAGTGATLAGDPTAQLPLKARPPDVAAYFTSPPEIARVAPGSPADANAGCPAQHAARTGTCRRPAPCGALRRATLDGSRQDRRLARPLLDGRSRSGRLGYRRARRYGAADCARSAGGAALADKRVGETSPGHDRPDDRVHGRGRAAAPDAQLRPDRRALRARARVQCRRRRRPAARRGTSPPLRAPTADRLRVDREPAGVSDHRARDSLLPHALAPARSLSLAPRRPAPRRCRRSSDRR